MRNLVPALFVIAFLSGRLAAEELFVGASTNAGPVVKEIAAAFEAQSGQKVRVSIAASGTLYSQIVNGAPFDVFLSADEDYPRRLEQAGAGVPGTRRVYALGRLVLWTRKDSGIDVEGQGMRALLDGKVRRVAIANPARAPYGVGAVEALRRYRLYGSVESKLVLGDSLAQAAQFVESGASEVGIIGRSLVLSPSMRGKGAYWPIPATAHEPIKQAVVILKKKGRDRRLAHEFIAFLLGAPGRNALLKYGYALPDGAEGGRP